MDGPSWTPRSRRHVIPPALGADPGVGGGHILIVVVDGIVKAVISARKVRPAVTGNGARQMVGSDVAEKRVQLLSLRAENIGYERIDSGPPHRRKVKAHDLKDPPRSRLPGIGDPLGPGGVAQNHRYHASGSTP